MKRIVIVSDLQIPYHDSKYVAVLEKFINAWKPDEVGQIGDLVDEPEPSRWNKNLAGEYAPTLQKSLDKAKEIIQRLNIRWVKYGNHDQRIETYVNRYAPALASLDFLKFEKLMELEKLGVTLHRDFHQIAPGWVIAHGHEGNLSPIGGRTAFNLAKRLDQSVMTGHTHRAGVVSETTGFNGRTRTLTGIEIGHGMQVSKADYVKNTPNWQQAFGVMYVEGQSVQAYYVPVRSGRFTFLDGSRWEA